MAGKQDNGSYTVKQAMHLAWLREQASTPWVLEGFAGEGRLWRSCWSGVNGATIDLDVNKAQHAAEARKRWAVYHGDTEHVLQGGWMGHQVFDAVDLDAYGSPWKFLRAWFHGERKYAARTTIFLTDGYGHVRNVASVDRCLFPGAPLGRMRISVDGYREQVFHQIGNWGAGRFDVVDLETKRSRQMLLHRLVLDYV